VATAGFAHERVTRMGYGRFVGRSDEDSAVARAPRGSRVPPGERSAVRDAIRRAIAEEVSGLTTTAEVHDYLAELERRARARGSVTALEVEPGFAAVRQLPPGDDAVAMELAFSRRMLRLTAELEGAGADTNEASSRFVDRGAR
jgi:hypothetical protein